MHQVNTRKAFKCLFLGLTLLGCVNVAQSATHSVGMLNFQFNPRDISISVGDTVHWVNDDFNSHDTVSGMFGVPSGIWNSNDQYGRLMRRNETYDFTFQTAGNYPYYCTPHWAAQDMNGSVTVTSANNKPTVALIAPANNASFATTTLFTLEATASDSDGSVTSVEFFDGGNSLGSDSAAPYTVDVGNFTAGQHVLTARATDNQGAFTDSAAVNITVAAGGVHVVDMANNQFTPRDLNISAGDTVTWINRELTQHDSVSGMFGVPDGVWNSNDQYGRLMQENETFSFTFPSAGSFPYYCTPHWLSEDMNGSITVTPSENNAPVISLVSPADGALFPDGASVTIEASASDPDAGGSVAGVQFFDGANSLGTDMNAPYSIVANNLAPGAHILTAQATDNLGAVTTSDPVTVNISGSGIYLVEMVDFAFSPRNLSIAVGESVTWVNTGLADHDSVSGIGGTPGGIWDSNDQYGRLMKLNETFTFTFPGEGSFPYYCTPHWQSEDMNGTISVANTPPAISLVAPAPGAVFSVSSSFVLQANASDSDIGGSIASVEFFDGANSLGSDSTAPYEVTASGLSAGDHTLTAQATDDRGTTTTSASVVVTVKASGVHVVEMVDFSFVPRDLSVEVGDTVTWVNTGVTGHDSVNGMGGTPGGIWDSNDQYGRLMNHNETYSFQFQSAGAYPYYCTPHWSTDDMAGTVTVNSGPITLSEMQWNGSSFSFTFPTVPGLTYHVDASTGIPAQSWTRIHTETATGSSITFTDQDGLPTRYYRVVAE